MPRYPRHNRRKSIFFASELFSPTAIILKFFVHAPRWWKLPLQAILQLQIHKKNALAAWGTYNDPQILPQSAGKGRPEGTPPIFHSLKAFGVSIPRIDSAPSIPESRPRQAAPVLIVTYSCLFTTYTYSRRLCVCTCCSLFERFVKTVLVCVKYKMHFSSEPILLAVTFSQLRDWLISEIFCNCKML